MSDTTQGGYLISQLARIQGRVFNRLLEQSGIDEFNGAQGRILYVLWQSDNLTIAELAKKTGLAKSTLTSMLDRMEEAGHVRRVPDETDRRQIHIVLTDKARSLNADYERVSAAMSRLFYQGFTDDDIRSFEEQLRRILENLTRAEVATR